MHAALCGVYHPADGSDLWLQYVEYYEGAGICIRLSVVQGEPEDPVWCPGWTMYSDLLSMDFLFA